MVLFTNGATFKLIPATLAIYFAPADIAFSNTGKLFLAYLSQE